MNGPLPRWLHVTVVLTLLGLLAYSVVVIGPEGLPLSYALIGALGIYSGVDNLLKKRQGDDKDSGDGT